MNDTKETVTETPAMSAAEPAKKPKKEYKALKNLGAKSGKMVGEFKKFAFKGNIIDLAIAVIIGAAFGKIISSLVADIVMPAIGVLIGDVEFSQLKIILKPAQIVDGIETVPESAIRYGAFIQTVIEFFIIALSIFIVFQIIMKIKSVAIRKKAEAPAAPPPLTKTEALLTDIKQLLTEQNNAVTAAEPAPDKKPKT